MMIRCLLVDDEHFALALLEKYVAQVPDLQLAASCRSPVQAAEFLQREPVDLVFLDIQMPLLNGLDLLRQVAPKPVAVFTTAYARHAHEAYDLDAVDYLLKPFSFERFERAVEKARELLKHRHLPGQPEGCLQVKAGRRWVNIPYSDILYIEGWKEYVRIYTEQGRIITLESLGQLEQTLPEAHFLRVHKSYIIAKNRVRSFDGNTLLVGETPIPVARARKRSVLAALFPDDIS